MDLLVATNNLHKLKEIKEILGEIFDNIFSLKDKNIEVDVDETGATFAENAMIKAKTIFELAHITTIADDSGLCVDTLKGAPGIYSARYAGTHGKDFANNILLLKNLNGHTNRRAHFECSMVLVTEDKSYIATGKTFGSILTEPLGANGFGYDPIFYSDELKKSFGLATDAEKNSISHRGKALSEMLLLLAKDGLI